MTEQGEKTGNRKRFVTVANRFPINSMLVLPIRNEGNNGIYGDHEQDSNDTRRACKPGLQAIP